MPTPQYTALATTTLGSSASSVTFSSFSSGYRDLMLVITFRSSASNDAIIVLNSDSTSTNYPEVVMWGNGSSGASFTQNGAYITLGNLTNDNQVAISNIMDYSATDKHKTILTRSNTSTVGVASRASRWANTAAVTSVQVTGAGGGTLPAGCSFSLYGVK